jgi:kynureninase
MPSQDIDIYSRSYAESQDAIDPLSHFRQEFHIPSLTDLQRPTIAPQPNEPPSKKGVYLCGNSLGLQPKRTTDLINTFLSTWRSKVVKGHFFEHTDSPLPAFLHTDDYGAKLAAPLVGALESEVAIMGTLTANLHILMSSFYLPSKPTDGSGQGKWKIMLEGKAFPSDHFAVESQITHHGLDPAEAMILLEPRDPDDPILKTEDILSKIDEHAHELALILLPGIQYYSGQYFDIARITAHAHSHGILIGWDCAHAAGNVELKLHEWDVDFAAWCNYKYLNSGPGAMAGIFVHERFGKVDMSKEKDKYWPRLTGWWGDDKSIRFNMANSESTPSTRPIPQSRPDKPLSPNLP